jgi:hypothetical protein
VAFTKATTSVVPLGPMVLIPRGYHADAQHNRGAMSIGANKCVRIMQRGLSKGLAKLHSGYIQRYICSEAGHLLAQYIHAVYYQRVEPP